MAIRELSASSVPRFVAAVSIVSFVLVNWHRVFILHVHLCVGENLFNGGDSIQDLLKFRARER